MTKKRETPNNKAINYEPLLCAVNPIKDNSTYEYWAKLDSSVDGDWHHVVIMHKDGVRTNYIDGAIV